MKPGECWAMAHCCEHDAKPGNIVFKTTVEAMKYRTNPDIAGPFKSRIAAMAFALKFGTEVREF